MAKILIVDDEAPVREIAALILVEAGHTVRCANHGRRALELIAEDLPDLVLSDIMMPVLDGAELCRRLKAREETRSIPVILMSAAGPMAADRAGADAFLDKPFDLDELEGLVARMLARRATSQAEPPAR